MKKIVIFDANSILNRAFYGIRRPLTTRDGLPTGAVFGYINIVKKHLDALRPDFAVAAFDVHAPTFRHKYDERYKATRKPMPEELRAQMPYLRRATEALGLCVVEKEGYEADDILGTLSRVAESEGAEAYLVTGDRDSYQLVSDKTTLILASTGADEEITPAVIHEKFGLLPRQMIQVKALAGDTSDNIPGVRGIGEKTAVKLIAERGSLDGVYEDIDSLPVGPSAKEKLLAGKEDAYRSLFLAEICREVPELVSLAPYAYEGIRGELLRPLLLELEFAKLLQSFHLEETAAPAPAPLREDPLQGSMFDQPEAEEMAAPQRDAATLLGVEPLFLSFDGEAFYALCDGAPCRLTGDVAGLLMTSRPVVRDSKAYYHHVSEKLGIEVRAGFDLYLASYVLDSRNTAMTLSRLSVLYGKGLWCDEADAPRGLTVMAEVYEPLRCALEESEAKSLYFDVELPLARVLFKMEKCGFRVSAERIASYGEFLLQGAEAIKAEIFSLAGEEFNVLSPKQLGRILFEKLGLPAGKKTKTGYATDAETLSKLRFHSPMIDLILQYRTFSKLHSTYVEGLLRQIGRDGRIHTVFNQMLTATGRLSSAEPNLQNIPVKTELGREMRKFFTAENEAYVLIDADYSQIELRLLAHMSEDETLCRYFTEGRDIHTKTAAEIFHVTEDEVTPEMRKSAKAVNFGIVYGIGEYSLSQDLGIPVRVAKDYITKYFALFPKVRSYLDGVKAAARETGFVTTLFGRRRMIPELHAPKKPVQAFGERVAMNAPIQGTAADIIKLAMVRVDERLEKELPRVRLVLQVHDELILEAPREDAEKAAALLQEEMERVVSYRVPLVAEAAVGDTWFDAK